MSFVMSTLIEEAPIPAKEPVIYFRPFQSSNQGRFISNDSLGNKIKWEHAMEFDGS